MSSSSSTQLSFALRTSANVKTVHLVGNWDGYKGQLPLARDASSSKAGAWKGTFRFSSKVMSTGRYWYYYIMDGYHVSHDPAQPFTTEPTTGRQLNILDVPATGSSSSKSSSSKPSSSSSKSSSSSSSHRSTPSSTSTRTSSSNSSSSNSSRSSSNSSSSSRSSNSSSSTSRSSSSTSKTSSSSSSNPIKGRPVSPSRIAHPRPVHPSSTTQQRLQSTQYAKQVAHLSRKLAKTKVSRGAFGSEDGSGSEFEEDRMAALANFSSDEDSEDDSDISDSLPSLGGSSRTSACSSPSSRTSSGFSYAEVKPAFTHAHSHGRSGSTSSSSSVCSCDRWGITRKGDRVRLDCGGSRCGSASPGYSSGSSDEGERRYAVAYPTGMTGFGEGGYKYGGGLEGCSSSDDSESDAEEYKVRVQPTVGVRRNGVVVRGGSRR